MSEKEKKLAASQVKQSLAAFTSEEKREILSAVAGEMGFEVVETNLMGR